MASRDSREYRVVANGRNHRVDFSRIDEVVAGAAESVVREVCAKLEINEDEITEYAQKLDYDGYMKLFILLSPIPESELTARALDQPVMDKLRGLFDLDFRYRCTSFDESVIFGPLFFGCQGISIRQDFAIDSTGFNENSRILVQCVSEHGSCFPSSLRLRLNDFVVIGDCDLSDGCVLDVSDICGPGTTHFDMSCSVERCWSCLVLRRVEKIPIEELIRSATSVYDATLSDNRAYKAGIPARAVTCSHTQRFDLLKLIKHTRLGVPLRCPICDYPIAFSEVAIDMESVRHMIESRLVDTAQILGYANTFDVPSTDTTFVNVATQGEADLSLESIDVGTNTFDF